MNDFFKKGEKEKSEKKKKKRTVLNQHVTTLSNEFILVCKLHCYSNSFFSAGITFSNCTISLSSILFFAVFLSRFILFFFLLAQGYGRFVYTCLSATFCFCFFFFYCTFRDDDINTYITLARNEWNSSWVAAVARGSAERRCATRSSFFERAPALIPLFTLLCSHFKRNIAKGSTYQNKHSLLKLIMNKQN